MRAPESPKSPYELRFNAPALGGLTGVDTDVVPGRDIPPIPGGMFVNDVDLSKQFKVPRDVVLSRKGWFAPDLTLPDDFKDNTDDDVEQEEPEEDSSWLDNVWPDSPRDFLWPDSGPWDAVWPDSLPWNHDENVKRDKRKKKKKDKTLNSFFPGGVRYGYRFMYNPSVLTFGIGLTRGVNTSYMLSGNATAMPSGVSATGSSIGLSFPISRIDDLALLRPITGKSAWDLIQQESTIISDFTTDQIIAMYGKGSFGSDITIPGIDSDRVMSTVTKSDLDSIAARGTMYDIDFMFRTSLGRQWLTLYRGWTADTGIAFSIPLILYLSSTMIYRVRLTSIGFTHKMFTPDMIPTYTEVTLGFERIPDVQNYSLDPKEKDK